MKNDGITPRILNTPLNDLTEPEFIFRVLDEFQNCGWYGKADEVVALVGVNYSAKLRRESRCAFPGCTATYSLVQLKNCGRCNAVKYCGKECSKWDWKRHKKTCKAK